MTFEEFKEMAMNPPRRNEETIFEVIEYDVCDLPEQKRNHYPTFNVRHSRVGICHTLPEAESLMRKAIERATGYHDEIYCFHIKEYPVGELISSNWAGYGESWRLYDSTGMFLDKTYCSDLERDHRTEYGQYRGRPIDSFRFKEGEIVEVLDGDKVRLAVAASNPSSIEEYWHIISDRNTQDSFIWKIFESAVKEPFGNEEFENGYIYDSSDDQVTVIYGPGYDTHEHVHILNIMPLRYPLSQRLRKRYEGYYKESVKKFEAFMKQWESSDAEF